jgi:8-oxo-dGTP pyrophosphatase MutT (NUDIX family)
MNPWKTLSSRLVYENPWFSVREDQVTRPDGSEGTYSVVQLPESVGIVAIDDSNRVALVRQWRYAHEKLSLEIPTGSIDSGDTSPAKAAARELKEEVGASSEEWKSLGSVDNSNGATTDVAHIFLATQVQPGKPISQPDEMITLEWWNFDAAVEAALKGEITESVSVAALLKVAALREIR